MNNNRGNNLLIDLADNIKHLVTQDEGVGYIDLKEGTTIIIDKKYHLALSSLSINLNKGYPRISFKGYPVRVYRLIYYLEFGILSTRDQHIDHINRDKLDNRIENLRIVTPRQNSNNRSAVLSKNTSKYKGVYLTINCKWQPRIQLQGEKKNLGSYDSEDKAAIVYNCWARYYLKDYACLNIVEDSSIKPYDILEKEEEECAVYTVYGKGKPEIQNKSNIYKVCPTCRESFSTLNQNQKYCSVKCYGLSSRKVKRPSKKELQKLVWEKPTTHIAKEYGVSDVAVKKWCKKYQIEKPPRGYWAKYKTQKQAN